MNNRSIDGLKRRSSVASEPVLKRRSNHAGSSVSMPKRPSVAVENGGWEEDENDEAIRDFLMSVKDDDPTHLVKELPKKPAEKELKKSKKLKKLGKTKKSTRKRVLKIVLWVLGGLFVVIVGVGVWLFIQGNDLVARTTGGNLLEALFADPDVLLETDAKTGRTNILVFGTEGYEMDDPKHPGGHLTDSMMVASLDQDSGDVKMFSLPRDLKVRTCNATSKLNELYICSYYKNKGTMEGERAGARALANQAEEILGLEIQYFVHLNWRALVQIVDALGGIDVVFVYKGTSWSGDEVAIETMDQRGLRDYWNPRTQTWGIDFKNGQVAHLNGEQALGVARSRNESSGYGSGSNYSREQFQQKIIQAMVLKAKNTNFATDFMALLNIKNAVGDNLRMDFKDKELKTLFKLMGKIDVAKIKSISIERTDDGKVLISSSGCGTGTNGVWYSYECPTAGVGNYSAIAAYVARKLSSDPVMSENAQILVMNATSAVGVAAQESARLKAKNFNVIQNMNAPSVLGEVEGVKIYQKNKSMSGTAKALKAFYKNVTVLTEIPDALTKYSADFIVVLGNGYAAAGE